MKETLVNNASSALNGSITDVATSLTVLDGSGFPASGEFRLIIGDELLLCTERNTNTLTVERGVEGTTAAAHADGSPVVHIVTAGALQRYGRDNDPYFDSDRPPLGRLRDASGNVLTSADFSWDNQSTSTVTDQNGTLVLRAPAVTGENCRVLYTDVPATPYSAIACVSAFAPCNTNFPNAGFGFRESGTGKLHLLALSIESLETGPKLAVYKYTTPTNFSAASVTRVALLSDVSRFWIRVTDDGTNLIFEIGPDGMNWIQIWSEVRTNFMAGGRMVCASTRTPPARPGKCSFRCSISASRSLTAPLWLTYRPEWGFFRFLLPGARNHRIAL